MRMTLRHRWSLTSKPESCSFFSEDGVMATETARLMLRRPMLADVPELFAFLGDAAAMQYTHVDASIRDCRRRVAAHERRRPPRWIRPLDHCKQSRWPHCGLGRP